MKGNEKMTTTEKRKANIGLRRLVVWSMTTETTESITYGTAHEFSKALMTMTDTPSASSGALEADDQIVDELAAVDGGELKIGVTGILAEERQLLYGTTARNGTDVTNKDDDAPYVCVACMFNRGGGSFELRKYPRVKFLPGEEKSETKRKGQVQYYTTDLSGSYSPTLHNGDIRYIRVVDAAADKSVIDSWFTDAAYNGTEAAAAAQTTE
jgi:phi13 family phage major tail protein